jgi:hypothetical protein
MQTMIMHFEKHVLMVVFQWQNGYIILVEYRKK